jgi:xanthine/uracil permease
MAGESREREGQGLGAGVGSAGAMPQGSLLDVPFDGKVGWFLHATMTVQNVFALVGMFLFPAVLGAVAGLKPSQVTGLYGATFIVTGVGTVLQGVMGLKMPIVIGPWAGSLAGLLATVKGIGPGAAFGSMFVAALIWTLIAIPVPRFSPIGFIARSFREPILYGGMTIIAIAALTNITVVNWIGMPSQPGFGAANWVGGAVAIVAITALITLTKGSLRSTAMLVGVVFGAAAYAIFHPISFSVVRAAPWFKAPTIFGFGFGVNGIAVILFFLLLLPAVATSLSHYNLLADWARVDLTGHRMAWGIFGLSLGGVLAGLLGAFSLSVYPDNLAIVRSSRVGSRWITASAGALLIVVGFIPKIDAFFVAVPSNVIGAAAVVLFGILFMSGVAAVSRVEWDQLNLLTVGLPFMLSMGGLFVPVATGDHRTAAVHRPHSVADPALPGQQGRPPAAAPCEPARGPAGAGGHAGPAGGGLGEERGQSSQHPRSYGGLDGSDEGTRRGIGDGGSRLWSGRHAGGRRSRQLPWLRGTDSADSGAARRRGLQKAVGAARPAGP